MEKLLDDLVKWLVTIKSNSLQAGSTWFTNEQVALYIRVRYFPIGLTIDVSNIQVDEEFKRQGIATLILKTMELHAYMVRIENVLSLEMTTLANKLGYEKTGDQAPYSYVKVTNNV